MSTRPRRAAMQIATLSLGFVLAACIGQSTDIEQPPNVVGNDAAESAGGSNTAGSSPSTAETGPGPTPEVGPGTTEASESPRTELPTATPQVTPSVGIVRGVVRSSEGEPLHDASVAPVEGTAPFPQMAVYSDAEGRYEWRLPPGTYTLEAYRDGYSTEQVEITLTAGEPVEADFTLTSGG